MTTSTSIATATPDDIFVRGKSLCHELMGRLSFTEMMFFHVLGRIPTPGEREVVDASLLALMEHGLTPSVLAARLVYSSAPEALQAAVGAGLMGVGSRFVGTVEGCAALLERMIAAEGDLAGEAARIVEEHRADKRPLPGFGHTLHDPEDPRTPRLFALARQHGLSGRRIAAIEVLSSTLDFTLGRHLTINATGAVAAVLGDVGVPAAIMRGFVLVARCAGLVGHIHEEQQRPVMMTIWEAAEDVIPYDGATAHPDSKEGTP